MSFGSSTSPKAGMPLPPSTICLRIAAGAAVRPTPDKLGPLVPPTLPIVWQCTHPLALNNSAPCARWAREEAWVAGTAAINAKTTIHPEKCCFIVLPCHPSPGYQLQTAYEYARPRFRPSHLDACAETQAHKSLPWDRPFGRRKRLLHARPCPSFPACDRRWREYSAPRGRQDRSIVRSRIQPSRPHTAAVGKTRSQARDARHVSSGTAQPPR